MSEARNKWDQLEKLCWEVILLLYADDLIMEFLSWEEFDYWDKYRRKIWEEMGFVLNIKKT